MNLFDSFQIKRVCFPNRVVMAPMVPFGLPQNHDGTMSREQLQHYLRRASNGMGLMISQSLSVTSSKAVNGGVGVYADAHADALGQLTEACHSYGTKFFAQLAYPGVAYPGDDSVNRLTEQEMQTIGQEFIRAAEICRNAGCDGIELHGAHGFFLNAIASLRSNRREDRYGGDLNGRLTLVVEIVGGIRSFAGDDFVISYRMGWNDDREMDIETALALERMGIELLHISHGIPADRKTQVSSDLPYSDTVYAGVTLRRHVHIPVIVVGGIGTLDRGNALLEKNLCDFTAYGRPFLADETFMSNSLENNDYRPCFECRSCRWFIDGTQCPARAGMEKRRTNP